MTLATLLLILASGLTAILSGILGMAGGLVLMGVAASALPASGALAFHGCTQFVSNGSRGLILMRHVRWPVVGAHAAGAIVAFLVARRLGFVPDEAVLLIVLGLIPFVARLIPARLVPDATRPRAAAACGFITTGVQLVAGVAGPLLDVFFVDAPMERREIVATKAVTQSLAHAMKVAYFLPLALGSLSWPLLAGSAIAALIGTRIGTLLLERVGEAAFRKWTRVSVLALGAVFLCKGLLMLAA